MHIGEPGEPGEERWVAPSAAARRYPGRPRCVVRPQAHRPRVGRRITLRSRRPMARAVRDLSETVREANHRGVVAAASLTAMHEWAAQKKPDAGDMARLGHGCLSERAPGCHRQPRTAWPEVTRPRPRNDRGREHIRARFLHMGAQWAAETGVSRYGCGPIQKNLGQNVISLLRPVRPYARVMDVTGYIRTSKRVISESGHVWKRAASPTRSSFISSVAHAWVATL